MIRNKIYLLAFALAITLATTGAEQEQTMDHDQEWISDNMIGQPPANASRVDCARFWLEKAMELHEIHIDDPSTTTNESQIELMDQITNAYNCVQRSANTTENATDQAELDCVRPWLEMAMELHDLHLREPGTATNESQDELMDQISRAHMCITGEDTMRTDH